jgi:hypothetical protein
MSAESRLAAARIEILSFRADFGMRTKRPLKDLPLPECSWNFRNSVHFAFGAEGRGASGLFRRNAE